MCCLTRVCVLNRFTMEVSWFECIQAILILIMSDEAREYSVWYAVRILEET